MFGAKVEPTWHQNRIKHRNQLRKAIFQKAKFFLKGKNKVFGDPRGRSWEDNSIKTSIKKGSQHGVHLGMDVRWIFGGFWEPGWVEN